MEYKLIITDFFDNFKCNYLKMFAIDLRLKHLHNYFSLINMIYIKQFCIKTLNLKIEI